MFEVVSVIDLNKNRFTPLLGDNKFFSDYGSDELGLQDKLDIIAKKRMHPDEKEKFTSFADFSTIVERVRESEHGYISSIFHIFWIVCGDRDRTYGCFLLESQYRNAVPVINC